MIKMLVLDIDGTIYRSDYTASEAVKAAIRGLVARGIKVVLATGRMYAAAVHVAREFGLNTPIISYQGGLVKEFYDSDKTLLQCTLPVESAKIALKILKEKNIHFNLYMDDTLIVETDSETIRKYTDERKIKYRVVSNFDEIELKNINKILAIDTNAEKIEALTDELNEIFKGELYIVRSTPNFCEIANKEATKGNAIRYLAKKWNIKKEEIMACGDQDNDIEMLLSAGTKVAMGNATEKLKEIADFITDTVDNDGVCLAIEKFIEE